MFKTIIYTNTFLNHNYLVGLYGDDTPLGKAHQTNANHIRAQLTTSMVESKVWPLHIAILVVVAAVKFSWWYVEQLIEDIGDTIKRI